MTSRRPNTLEMRARRLFRRLRAAARLVSEPRAALGVRREAAARAALAGELAGSFARFERPEGRKILVVAMSDDAESAALEALVAKALQLRGARLAVLLHRTAFQTRLHLRALGVERLYYQDFERQAATGLLDAELERCSTVQDYKQLTYRGARVGRHALSTFVRSRHDPSIDLAAPDVRAGIRRLVDLDVQSAYTAEAVLDAVRPDVVLMIERGYVGFGAMFDVALERGVRVIQFQAAHRDDAFQLKRYTLDNRDDHPRSLDESTWHILQDAGLRPERERQLAEELEQREQAKWFMARRVRHARTRLDDDPLRQRLGLDRERKVAVLFSHVLWDASMFYGTDLYPDQGAWFRETLRLAAADDRAQWLVKLHPALYWKMQAEGIAEEPAELALMREAVGDLPPHVHLIRSEDDIHNADLFRIVDAGVTIRGTVGLELPRLGVPVLTAGTSDYTGRGFTVDAHSIAEYERNVASIPELERLAPAAVARANLYAYGVFCLRPWRFESFTLEYPPPEETGGTLLHRLRWNISTVDELRRAEDLSAFAKWVLSSDAPDYVASDLRRTADAASAGAIPTAGTSAASRTP